MALLSKDGSEARQVTTHWDTGEPCRAVFVKHHVKVSLRASALTNVRIEQVRAERR